MTDDKESLLDNLQAVPAPDEQAAAPVTEEDMSAVADALLQASLAAGGEPSVPGEGPAPDENPNPELAVEEMLSEAVLADPPPAEAPPAPAASAVPTFQVRIFPGKDAPREELKKAAADLGLALPDATWALDAPLVSQLTEYQALSFLQRLRALGLHGAIDVRHPHSAPSEDDLALGELSAVAETPPVRAEGGAAVKLAGDEKSVLLYTGESLPAFPVARTLGLVSAHRSLPRRLFREDEVEEKLRRELGKIPGRGASSLPGSRVEILLRELSLDLQKAALAVAGNAVLGIKIQAFPETSHLDPALDEMRLVAFGTAAVVEKWDP